MKLKVYFMIISLILLSSCEGSRSRRMLDSVEHAIDSHNNTEIVRN